MPPASIPPPAIEAVFPLIVDWLTLTCPRPKTPPPYWAAAFPLIESWSRISGGAEE
jgi:hypothetical protein